MKYTIKDLWGLAGSLSLFALGAFLMAYNISISVYPLRGIMMMLFGFIIGVLCFGVITKSDFGFGVDEEK